MYMYIPHTYNVYWLGNSLCEYPEDEALLFLPVLLCLKVVMFYVKLHARGS